MRGRFTLPDSPYSVGVTDLSQPLNPPSAAASLDNFTNRNAAATFPIQLVANAPPVRVLPRNLRRSGLQIVNLDASADLIYAFGNNLGRNGIGLLIVPRGTALYDFTTPADELYLFSTANITAMIMEVTRLAGPPKKA